MRTILLFIAVLSSLWASSAPAQTPDSLAVSTRVLQLGGGYTHTPDGSLGAGANAVVSLQGPTRWGGLRLRRDGFASLSQWRNSRLPSDGEGSDDLPSGTHLLAGIGAGVQIERSSGVVHPYFFGTVNEYGEWSPVRPFRFVPGVAAGVGASANWKGREWFTELSARTFGAGMSRMITVWPLSIGLRF